MRLTIVAASGGTGRHVLHQAMAAGHDVTAVVRNPAKLDADVRTVTQDLTDPDPGELRRAVDGADAVVSCLGPRTTREAGIAAAGTKAIVSAMDAAGVRRLVVISSESMTTIPSPGRPNPPKHDPGEGFVLRYVIGPFARNIVLRKHYEDLGRMEDLVRASGLDWTIARPALLVEKPATATGTYRTAVDRKPRGGFKIARADVAHFMLDTLRRPETIGQAISFNY